MNVTLLAHTQLTQKFWAETPYAEWNDEVTSGQAIALSAIRTCYSANKPSEIVAKEGAKYFGNKASDGAAGTEADRLIRQIVASKHLSTVEHLTFTFSIEGVSRALLAQITRHRVGFSFSVQSQRYVRFGSGDRSGGFDYVTPEKVLTNENVTEVEDDCGGFFYNETADEVFKSAMRDVQIAYDKLRSLGVPAEDARAVLPQAAACNLVMTANLRSLLDFYAKRKDGNGAQGEIAALAERLKDEVVAVEPWTEAFFN